MKKLKIFYFMHVHWRWIEQRPHFIAKALGENYDVNVFYRRLYNDSILVDDQKGHPGFKITGLFVLRDYMPGISRVALVNRLVPMLSKIGDWVSFKFRLRAEIRKYDIIWVTHPEVFRLIEDFLPSGVKVVYDCMDNALEFPQEKKDPVLRQERYECERRLIDRSDIVLASSDSLKQTLIERYGADSGKAVAVVNNGISLPGGKSRQLLRDDIEGALEKKGFKLSYVGTVSEWLDFKLILEALDKFKDLSVLFFGPLQTKLPEHGRIFHFGPVAHKYIYGIMERSDALFMPFELNELVLGVNPVKLYEYIYSCKPAIAVRYPETARFEEYVHLYSDAREFCDILSGIMNKTIGLKKSCQENVKFAESNTWEKRGQYIGSLIHG